MCAQQLSSRYAYVDPDRAAEFNFSKAEWAKITDSLTRNPNSLEALILGRAWSDELTGKSGALFLRGVYRESPNATPTLGNSVAALNIGFDEQVILSARQVNHLGRNTPSLAIQTAIAELIQELSLRGAKPLGAGFILHVGDVDSARSSALLGESIREICHFATTAGLPFLEHQLYTHSRYEGMPVINMTAWGIRTMKAPPEITESLLVFYAGKRPPPICDRLGKPPRVARIDPSETLEFGALLRNLERLPGVLAGATIARGGIALAGAHLAAASGSGIQINLDPFISEGKKNSGLEEILFSEAPNRALFLIAESAGRAFSDLVSRSGFLAIQLGEATKGRSLDFLAQHQLLSSLPFTLFGENTEQKTLNLISNPPMLHSSAREPVASEEENVKRSSNERPRKGIPIEDRWLDLLANPNIASKKLLLKLQDTWGGGLPLLPGSSDASLFRIPAEESRAGIRPQRALGLSLVSLPLSSSVDPYLGSAHAVADGCRRLAASGCSPLAAIQLLNFGDPEKYKQISEFAEAVRGMSDTCRLWSIPILSDTVSFRNTIGSNSILPTPAILLCGILPDTTTACPNLFQNRGDSILLIGDATGELSASEFQSFFLGTTQTPVPNINFAQERSLCEAVSDLIQSSLLASVKNISIGGVAAALTDAAFGSGRPNGASLTLNETNGPLENQLFGECGGRFLVSCKPEHLDEVKRKLAEAQISIRGQGTVGGKELTVKLSGREVAVPAGAAYQIWSNTLGTVLGAK